MAVEFTGDLNDAVVVADMAKAGQADGSVFVKKNYWRNIKSVGKALREDGEIMNEGRSIRFKLMPPEFKQYENVYLPLRGESDIVILTIAEATEDWTPDAKLIAANLAKGKNAPRPFKKDKRMLRCYAD